MTPRRDITLAEAEMIMGFIPSHPPRNPGEKPFDWVVRAIAEETMAELAAEGEEAA